MIAVIPSCTGDNNRFATYLTSKTVLVKAKLKVPPTYMISVFIGIGYADLNETVLEQNFADLDKQLHYGRWK